APVSAPAPASAPQPLEVEPMALPPLGAATALEADKPAAEPEAPRVAVAPAPAPAAADLDLPSLPTDIQERGRDSAAPTQPKEADATAQPLPDAADDLPKLPSGPSGGPADEAPAVAPPAGSLNRRAEAVPAEAEAEPVPVPVETPTQEPAAEPVPAPAPVADPVAAPVAEPVAAPVEETPAPVAAPAPVQETPAPAPVAAPAFDPAQEAVAPRAPAAATRNRGVVERSESLLPPRANPVSTLTPELQNRVDEVARKMEDEYRISQAQPQPAAQPAEKGPNDLASDLRSQTQIDISRAPSPAEARPIRAIPVPEDWVPVGAREWSAQRKYWAAAATCHLPLYFQDPMLERYGHSVENFLGPKGRFLAYPVDKHTQTTQRNQIAQPFFSMGLFAGQILALPYNLIMDPPWEAQYDLGYWRPGDKIPTDMYYLPTHGIGPPLRGRQY
ncbi:MAG: hypothetical protein P4L85_29170, partial [Paludisphaera borealis]|nr:hypothetical protein [Paludisphaera borealis]